MGRHVAVLALVALVAGACGDDGGSPSTEPAASAGAPGIDEFGCAVIDAVAPEVLPVGEIIDRDDAGNDHEACPRAYDHSPPTSGAHFPGWQNCGFYSVPIRDEQAVHSLEHGAVWIAYDPDLAADEVAAIEQRVAGETHLLASPYPGLGNALVLSAWTRQMAGESVGDPAVEAFITDHAGRSPETRAPEAGVACDRAIGVPPDQPNAGR